MSWGRLNIEAEKDIPVRLENEERGTYRTTFKTAAGEKSSVKHCKFAQIVGTFAICSLFIDRYLSSGKNSLPQ